MASFENFLKFEHVSSNFLAKFLLWWFKNDILTDMDEIHRIIFEAPVSSDDLWQSSSEDSIRSSGSDSESKNAQTTHGSEQEVQFSTSGTSRQWLPAQRQCQRLHPVQQDQQTEWRPINEKCEVQYPEFAGPTCLFTWTIVSRPTCLFSFLSKGNVLMKNLSLCVIIQMKHQTFVVSQL